MKRPQRYLFIIMTVMVAVYLLLTRLPGEAGLALLVALALFALVVGLWGRDLLIARHHAKRRRWPQAMERYERFEKRLLRARWPKLTAILYLGIYSLDGVAIARNSIGQILLNTGDLDGAVRWLRAALQRDPLYAVPYVNLSVIAATRRDEATAKREMTRAVQLGFNPNSAQRILRRAIDAANEQSGNNLR